MPTCCQPARRYSRSASPPVTVSSTSTVRPSARAASSTAASRRRARPWRPALRCTSILATSARWGWLSGMAFTSCTVPTMPPCGSWATSSTRSLRATPSATVRQNASALSRGSGHMKLTDAPPCTQSISRWASAARRAAASSASSRRTVAVAGVAVMAWPAAGVGFVIWRTLGDGKKKWRRAARRGAARLKSGARGPPRDARRALPAGAAPVSVPGWRRCYRVAMRVLLKWLLSAVALLFVAYVYSGVEVRSFGAALIAAFVIGLFNVVLRPVLVLLTLPVTIVTLGLFLFVINALMFWAAASLLDGFQVTGFAAALLGSLIYSLLGVLIESALGGLFAQQ